MRRARGRRLRIEADGRTGEGVPVGEGAVYLMTLTKPKRLPDEAFQVGMRLLGEELHRLKAILEGAER